MKLFGISIDEVSRQEAIEKISSWIERKGSLKHVVTIYSEFLLKVEEDDDFRKAIKNASLVVPDGMGILAAMEYQRGNKGILAGLGVGLRGLGGDLGEPVTGVWLFEELVRLAAVKGWKVFLLGGYGDTAERLMNKLKKGNIGLKVEFDAGEQVVGGNKKDNKRVIRKINEFRPDLLMVAYGPGSQEKWIYENKKRLKVRVAIGLGGTFDEVLGEFPRAPRWMERRGLKAWWRLMVQPKRVARIFKGMVVFPWKVYRGR